LDNCSFTTVDEKRVDHRECMKERREIDGARAERAAIALADMHVAELVAALASSISASACCAVFSNCSHSD
jgi:hypothetical protein